MGLDYYKILGVAKNANANDIKKSYKKLAMKWHPDRLRNFNKKSIVAEAEAGAKFQQLTDAYDNLSDPRKRELYDRYGEESGKKGVPRPSAAEDMYADGRGSRCSHGGMHQDSVDKELPCSLEELFMGTLKNFKVSREVVDRKGSMMTFEEMISIHIKPGWKKGTKITFPGKGNERPGVAPADLVFILTERPHKVFTREGNDLVVTQNISLAEALTGCTVSITTLDGRSLTVPISNVISLGYEEVVPREGMPTTKDSTKRGNLRIKFNISFPSRLTMDQKQGLKNLMSS